MMHTNDIYKSAIRSLMLFCVWIALARFSMGFSLALMTILGVVWSVRGEIGKALSIYAMLLCMTVLNANILPTGGIAFGLGLRFGPLFIGMALALKGASDAEKRGLPLGVMIFYLVVAVLSSIGGWYPIVSYMKIVNFLVFFLGIWLGTRGLQHNGRDVFAMRSVLLALCIFLIAGSLAIWPFPGISTLNSIDIMRDVEDVALRNAIVREMMENGGMALFCGVTFHSQTLAPLLVCAYAWVMCDWLFIEGRLRWLHVLLLLSGLPLIFITRSRTALVALASLFLLVYFYLPRKISLNRRAKVWLGHFLLVGGIALMAVSLIAEMRSGVMSRWMRKVEDVDSDRRSFTEAVTSSRLGLVEMCMDDFRRRPLIGMGFQVAEYTKEYAARSKGLLLSSPIEKGVIPIMILGETGVMGALAFAAFLISFYFGCAARRLYVAITMMAVFLAINMGEATFFSPGGAGGLEWVLCIVGGYVLDLSVSMRKWEIRLP